MRRSSKAVISFKLGNMAKILVTGSSGLLGSTLLPTLSAAGHESITHARTHLANYLINLQDADEVASMIRTAAPDCIINLAALTNVDTCETDPDLAYRDNVLSVQNLVDSIQSYQPDCHLIHISTDQVYDGHGPHAENALTLRNTYAFSKVASEYAALQTSATVLRTNFFGRSLCEYRQSFSDWLVSNLLRKHSIKVFDDVMFSPLSGVTLSQVIEKLVHLKPHGVFNLGSREGMSKADFAYALARSLGYRSDCMHRAQASASTSLKARRPNDMRMDSSRMESLLGSPLPTLLDEIYSVGRDYLEHA